MTEIYIDSITGVSPFNIYVCQPDGNECFFIETTNDTDFRFSVPPPYNLQDSYMIKIIDARNFVFTSNQVVQ